MNVGNDVNVLSGDEVPLVVIVSPIMSWQLRTEEQALMS